MDVLYTAKEALKTAKQAHDGAHNRSVQEANRFVAHLVEAIKAAAASGETELTWTLATPEGRERSPSFDMAITKVQIAKYLRRNRYRWQIVPKSDPSSENVSYRVQWTEMTWSDSCLVQ